MSERDLRRTSSPTCGPKRAVNELASRTLARARKTDPDSSGANSDLRRLSRTHAHRIIDRFSDPYLHLRKSLGETELEGWTPFNKPKWEWPAR